jgi:indolepyruvate ferredoxin oxidoreductase alpha subunit
MLGLAGRVAFLKLAAPVPIPEKLVKRLLKSVKTILVVEEGEPVVERQVIALAKEAAPRVKILGRLTGTMPAVGELNPDLVVEGIAKLTRRKIRVDREREKLRAQARKLIAPRSSTLCAGCPHLGSYWALKQALKKVGGEVPIVNGDIGCYEQGGYGLVGKEYRPSPSEESVGYPIEAPYEILSTNYIMGGGIGLMQGQFQAGYGNGSLVAVAGDSTFFHACIPAVLNAVYNKSGGLFLVLDNLWTAMTGHQPDLRTGKTATGEDARVVSIEDLAKACGVDFVRVVDPYDLGAAQRVIEEALRSGKFAVVIARRVCALQAQRMKQFEGKRVVLNREACTGCKLCVSFGCPAVVFDSKEMKAGIDPILCNGCGMCAQVCPAESIRAEG